MSYKSRYDRGDWKAICESCGRIVKASQLKKRWDGFMVDERCWEPRQPQDFVRGVADYQAPPFTRPEPSDQFVPIPYNSGWWINPISSISRPVLNLLIKYHNNYVALLKTVFTNTSLTLGRVKSLIMSSTSTSTITTNNTINTPTVVSFSSLSGLTSTIVAPKPTGTTTGDLMIVMFMDSVTTATPSLAGWTLGINSNGSSMLYKVAGASEPTSYTFTFTGTTGTKKGTIATFRHAAYNSISTMSSGTTTVVAPAATVAMNNSMALAVITSNSSNSQGATTPTNYTILDANGALAVCAIYTFTAQVQPSSTGTASSTFGVAGKTGFGYIVDLSPN
jgi:hypothetical protein